MKNILIPTDFSENAWNAIVYALKLFKDEECKFYLLNTYTPAIASSRFMAASFDGGVYANTAHEFSENGLKRTIAKIKKKHSNTNHKFKTISSFALLTDEIVESISKYEIDLVVAGTKGASGVSEVFLGSNAVRMIKMVKKCPIMVIPKSFGFKEPTEIAFATDFNRFYTISELSPLIELARTFGAVIRIVNVQDEIKPLTELQRFNLDMLRKYLQNIEHYVHTVSELNSVSRTLERFSTELDIHLLAMLNYQHSYMERLSREPIIKKVAFHAQTPLLIIPELTMSSKSKNTDRREISFSN